ncbi:MAG: 5'/3'-nucleotidase SurE [Rhodothermia bacterium]|nr:MAG: 5'/3'-nucleotidase SurE [Rhodothermia bacterium]
MTHSSSSDRPLILICNDDGIHAPGILSLAAGLDGLGEIVVVAPVLEQSAVGHSITIRDPVRARPWPFRVPSGAVKAFSVSGTPADCVKLAIDKLLPRTPAAVVSGINQGPNAAVNIIYSGTVSAATEAAILGIPAVAISYCRWRGGDFEASARIARSIVSQILSHGLPPGVLLNVNVPDLPYDAMRGIAVTRQAKSKWEESFTERMDPFNQPYYWLSGTFINLDSGENTDLDAIENGFVSVTPIQHDLTAHDAIEALEKWNWEETAFEETE